MHYIYLYKDYPNSFTYIIHPLTVSYVLRELIAKLVLLRQILEAPLEPLHSTLFNIVRLYPSLFDFIFLDSTSCPGGTVSNTYGAATVASW